MALFEETDVLCVADREGGRVECINAGLQKPLHANRDDTGKRVVNYNQKVIGRPYAIASKGKLPTLDSGINIELRLLIFGLFSRGTSLHTY